MFVNVESWFLNQGQDIVCNPAQGVLKSSQAGIAIEMVFEGSMTAKSNYFKSLEKESFEKAVKEICLSVE